MNYIEQAENTLLRTYNRYQIVLDKGEGVYLYDITGKKYLDFVSGIAVFALGYGNQSFNDALKAQIDKLIHTSNFFYNVPAIEAGEKLLKASKMDRVFFTNSGTEAMEGALKTAMKYYYNKEQSNDYEIIAMEHSFHGRSLGALSITGNPKYREAFIKDNGQVKFAKLNQFDTVLDQVTDKTCAIVLETVQGEGGIYACEKEFLQKVRELCNEKDILLILDEIQCGMGRTGTMFAYESYGILPDIMTCAKALGCGVPVGAFLMTEKVASHSLVPGDHGTTYGGNPLVCAAVSKVFDLYEEENILEQVRQVGSYLETQVKALSKRQASIVDTRGLGLMQGIVMEEAVAPIIAKALEKGLILINAGTNIIRLVPPLIVTKEEVDVMISILETCIEECK